MVQERISKWEKNNCVTHASVFKYRRYIVLVIMVCIDRELRKTAIPYIYEVPLTCMQNVILEAKYIRKIDVGYILHIFRLY